MNRFLSRYLSVLTLIPVFMLILLLLFNLSTSYFALKEANKLVYDTQFVTASSNLIHELQKERGMTAGFIGSKGKKFLSQIKKQRLKTDQQIQNLNKSVSGHNLDPESETTIEELQKNLQQIRNIRQKVDTLTINLPSALSYYSNNNKLILDLNAHLAYLLKDSISSKKFLTLYNVGYIKEQAGIERAVLSNIFASDTSSRTLFTVYIELMSKQDTYLKSAFTVASPQYLKILNDFKQSKENTGVAKYRDIIQKNDKGFNVDASEWFNVATTRINKLKEIEKLLLNEIDIYAKQQQSSNLNLIIIKLVSLILMMLLAYFVFKTIQLRSAQSNEINRFMKKLDAEKDLTDTVSVITDDELGKIADLINITFDNIRTDFISFQTNAHQIGEATIQAASATEQSKSNLTRLQLDISSIASATEEMSVSINSVMENMKTASCEAEYAAQESINGEKAVEISTNSILQTADEVERVGQTITELNSRVADILGMVDVIKSVADQTNLLALNAAIEAARAGDQGRGFAVVADEVRTLAMRTQLSTQEISKVVDILNTSSQSAFSAIEIGNKRAKSAVENAQDISKVLNNIIKSIKLVDDANRTISDATQEQSTVIQSINTSIINIDDQARENVIGAEQLTESSYTLSKISNEMEDRIKLYKV